MKRALLLAIAAAVVACGSVSEVSQPTPSIAQVKIKGTAQGTGIGVSLPLRLEARDSAGRALDVQLAPRWSSSDSTVVYIDPNGLMTTFHLGQAVLRATVEAQGRVFSDSLQLFVIAPTG